MATRCAPLETSRQGIGGWTNSRLWPLVAVGLLVILQAWLVFNRPLHWDEFFYYLEVDQFSRGQLHRALQTFHVRLFAWLPGHFPNSVDAIIAGRTVMLMCEMATLVAIFGITRRFVSRTAAILSVLLYVSSSYVLLNGFTFRTDPMATATLMSALYLLASPANRRGASLLMANLAGILTGFAAIITIKSVLFAPVFAGLAWHRLQKSENSARELQGLLCLAAATAATFIVLYVLHAQGMGFPAGPDAAQPDTLSQNVAVVEQANANTTTMLLDTASRMFFLGKPNNLALIIVGIVTAPALIIAIPLTAWLILKRQDFGTRERLALLGLLFPVVTPLFYENTAPYYFVFMLAPVCCACGIAIEAIGRRVPAAILSTVLVAFLIPTIANENPAIIRNQRSLVAEVHAIFRKPVGYFDHAGMISGFDKLNNFMTPWGMKQYRSDGIPIYRRAMERQTVPLLLINWWLFGYLDDPDDKTFIRSDADALRENYIRIDGLIWIAGREVPAGEPARSSEFLVPGPYTVVGGPIIFDRVRHEIGDVFTVERGDHTFSAAGDKDARLIWGRNPKLPEAGTPLLIWPKS